ncbi:hypothetical protein ACWENQ_08510 [Nonomuraea sp. NPDC004354]
MRFADMREGTIARVPKVNAKPGDPLPPAVRIDHVPTRCGVRTCAALDVVAHDVESEQERYYHRKPDFQVIEITPAEESP